MLSIPGVSSRSGTQPPANLWDAYGILEKALTVTSHLPFEAQGAKAEEEHAPHVIPIPIIVRELTYFLG
ncbi:MAG: hypothetical protein SFY80_15155 [Verrucomicrobiota bacterium]|nr:hypothetical protein [Verrucomicrobiota bacterium]